MPSFSQLRQQRLRVSTRTFNARGIALERCDSCQLAERTCICNYTPKATSRCEFVILMHYDEIFKPTNTGRLIGDVLPEITHYYCWHRTEPESELLTVLASPSRHCMLLFPAPNDSQNTQPNQSKDGIDNARATFHTLPCDDKTPTFILLDGTWKQGGRMLRLSRWLDSCARFILPNAQVKQAGEQYLVRKASSTNQLATAQAAQLCLEASGDRHAAKLLSAYFDIFNQHYVATRSNTQVTLSHAHSFLAKADNSFG